MVIFRRYVISKPSIVRSIFSSGCILAACLALASPARASVIFDSLSFTLSNNPTCNSGNNCGSAVTANAGLSLVFTGENTGSGIGGNTDLLTIAPGNGLITFDWSYSDANMVGYETVGYLLQGTFFELANSNGQAGTDVMVSVLAGQSFGFEIQALDNTGEPGILTVSNFTAPSASIPEPGTLGLAIAGALALAVFKIIRHTSTIRR